MRSRLQQRLEGERGAIYRSAADVIRSTWRREGFWAFYRGWLPNVLRVVPQAAITLLVYESVLRAL